MRFLVGTYTHIAQAPSASQGVYLIDLNTTTLRASILDSVDVKNPSYVTVLGNDAYTLSECGTESMLHSVKIEGDKLRLTSSIKSPGDDPCNLVAMGDKLYSANYSSGSVAVTQIEADGTLGQVKQQLRFMQHGTSRRQQASHLHNIAILPSGKHVVASNLGGDCLHLFERKDNGMLQLLGTTMVKSESGPRHMVWDASGTRLYLVTELSDEVMTFELDGHALRHMQTLVAARTPGHGAGDLHIHPSGKWVYASVRLVDDGIALFSVEQDGSLTRKAFYSTGTHPRNFAITPCGTLLLCACRDKNAIEMYSINENDGTLTYLEEHDITIPLPVCITIF